MAAGLLAHARRNHALRPGLILIGDNGFAGREFEDLVSTFGLLLARIIEPTGKLDILVEPVHVVVPALG